MCAHRALCHIWCAPKWCSHRARRCQSWAGRSRAHGRHVRPQGTYARPKIQGYVRAFPRKVHGPRRELMGRGQGLVVFHEEKGDPNPILMEKGARPSLIASASHLDWLTYGTSAACTLATQSTGIRWMTLGQWTDCLEAVLAVPARVGRAALVPSFGEWFSH